MQQHELRQQVVTEMHLRRWAVLTPPCIIVQWVLELSPQERAQEATALDAKAQNASDQAVPPHRSGQLSERIGFAWERHSEGSSLTLRLQQLVEGLSVVALTYYLLSLVGYVLKGAQHHWPRLDVATILAVLVLPTALSIWLALHQLKRRVLGHGSKD